MNFPIVQRKEKGIVRLLGFFVSGIFLVNGIPHFIQGICGRSHMTPFNRISKPVTNVVWGLVNFGAGELILQWLQVSPWRTPEKVAFWLGGVATALYLSIFWSNPNARLPWHRA
jgi:hypothetical protein